jgi:hypothetical protein
MSRSGRRKSTFGGVLAERVAFSELAAKVELEAVAAEHCPKQSLKQELPGESRRLWRIIGGERTGGLLVRLEKELGSTAAEGRLATGSVVEQMELDGDRLHYYRLTGTGPHRGWITISLPEKVLAVPISDVLPTPGQQADVIERQADPIADSPTAPEQQVSARESEADATPVMPSEPEQQASARESKALAADGSPKLSQNNSASPADVETGIGGAAASRERRTSKAGGLPHDIEIEYSFQLPSDHERSLRELADIKAKQAGISVLKRDSEDSSAPIKAAEPVAVFCFSPPTSPHGSQDSTGDVNEYDFDSFNARELVSPTKDPTCEVDEYDFESFNARDLQSPAKVVSAGGA